MQLRQIEVFHAVMTTGSTVEAAERLNVTQPAVSTTLKRMQDELGLVLFSKMRGRLVPTPEAQTLFRQVRSLHEDIAQLSRLARRLAEGGVGSVRLGAVPAFGDTVTARALAGLRETPSDIQLSVDVLNTHELLYRLQAGRLDVVCAFGAHDHLPIRIMERVPIDLFGVVPAGWLPGRRHIEIGELGRLPLAAMRSTDPIGRVLDDALREQGSELDSSIELRSCRAAVAMAREGLAVGITDRVTAGEVGVTLSDDESRVRLLPLEPRLQVDAILATDARREPSQTERRVVAALVAAIETANQVS